MEMLTKNYADGSIGINCDDMACKVDGPCPETSECECVNKILKKLAVYEAIGTIEEFKALKVKEHNYDNCHNYTCRKKCEKDGYIKAIDEAVKRFKSFMLDNDGLSENDIMEIDRIAWELKGGAE